MKKKILVPIDLYEEELVRKIIKYIRNELKENVSNLDVHLLSVVSPPTYNTMLSTTFIGNSSWGDKVREETKNSLKIITQKLMLPNDNVHIHIEEGTPSDRILELANSLHVDIIILASHKPRFSTYLLGSEAVRIARHAQCSVLIVR